MLLRGYDRNEAAGPGTGVDPCGRFSALEIASGTPFGCYPEDCAAEAASSPRTALASLVRPMLAQSPCFIAFSGGRDSSALLAVAVDLARREGWALPVPVTLRFTGASTDETAWQEMMLRHLKLNEWVRLDIADELDLLGPVARSGLQRHGLLYPANAHFIVPMARAATGGSLLTGVGGDDVFGNWPWHDLASVLAGRERLQFSHARRAAHLAAPLSLRAEIACRREPLGLPWIVASERRRVARLLAREIGGAPRTWSSRMLWSARWRPWRETVRSIELLARDSGANIASPFLDPGFLASLARAGGRLGWGNRGASTRALFGDLLPETVIRRRDKAEFSGPLFGAATRRFAAQWNGGAGPASGLIDTYVLREVWRSGHPHFLSTMALQAAWITSNSSTDEDRSTPEIVPATGSRSSPHR